MFIYLNKITVDNTSCGMVMNTYLPLSTPYNIPTMYVHSLPRYNIFLYTILFFFFIISYYLSVKTIDNFVIKKKSLKMWQQPDKLSHTFHTVSY